MKTGTTLLVCIIVSVLTTFAVTRFLPSAGSTADHKETSYERVMRTNTLRCGYEYWDGAIMKDEKGQIYGPWVDIMNAIGDAAGLKVEWTSQVGWGEMGAALKSGKIDAMCAGAWQSAMKAREMSFTNPLSYQALEAFVRADDHRFDGDMSKLDDPSVKIVVIEGDNTDFIAQQNFPKAQRISLSSLNGTDSEEMMNVMGGKADVCFTVMGQWQQFRKNNPDKIRPLAPDHKLRVFGMSNAVDNDDPRLLSLLNAAGTEIQGSGQLDKILDKANQDWPDMYLKGTKPY